VCIMFRGVKKPAKSNSNEKRPEDVITGARFRAAREAAGLTQPELAARLGWGDMDSDVGQKKVSSYETGRRTFGLEDALAWADAVGQDLYDIIGMKKQPVRSRK
jgi:transcriptional regulator with XRE-family HTH domain